MLSSRPALLSKDVCTLASARSVEVMGLCDETMWDDNADLYDDLPKPGENEDPAKNRGKPKAKAKNKPQPGKRRCKGCRLSFGPEGIALHQAVCHDCKRSLDALTRIAKRQGHSAWLSEARQDEEKLFKLMTSYKHAIGSPTSSGSSASSSKGGKKNRGEMQQFCLATYVETFYAKTSVIKDGVGEMMTLEELIVCA